MRKSAFIIGIVIATVFTIAIFMVGRSVFPPPTIVVATKADIPAGTLFGQIPESSFVALRLNGDANALGIFLRFDDLSRVPADAVVTNNITKMSPLKLTDLAFENNPTGVTFPSLGMSDPNLVAVRINTKNIAPSGLLAGDRINLIATVDNLPQSSSQYDVNYFTNDTGTGNPPAQPTPELLAPLSKTIVQGAIVIGAQYQSDPVAASKGVSVPSMGTSPDYITALVPAEAAEWVYLASSAGNLYLALLPANATISDTPTMGASIQDFIDLFHDERNVLNPQPSITPDGTSFQDLSPTDIVPAASPTVSP